MNKAKKSVFQVFMPSLSHEERKRKERVNLFPNGQGVIVYVCRMYILSFESREREVGWCDSTDSSSHIQCEHYSSTYCNITRRTYRVRLVAFAPQISFEKKVARRRNRRFFQNFNCCTFGNRVGLTACFPCMGCLFSRCIYAASLSDRFEVVSGAIVSVFFSFLSRCVVGGLIS